MLKKNINKMKHFRQYFLLGLVLIAGVSTSIPAMAEGKYIHDPQIFESIADDLLKGIEQTPIEELSLISGYGRLSIKIRSLDKQNSPDQELHREITNKINAFLLAALINNSHGKYRFHGSLSSLQHPALLERRRSLVLAKRKKAESEKIRPAWAGHSARLNDGNDNVLNIKYSDDGKTYSILLEYIETLGKSRCSGKVDRSGNLEKVDCSAQSYSNRYINGNGRIGGNVAKIVFLALDGPGASSTIGPWRDRDIAKRSQPREHQHIDTLMARTGSDDTESARRLSVGQKENIVIVGSLAVEGRNGYLSYRAIAPETGTILAASRPRKVYLGNVKKRSHRKDRHALGGIGLYESFEPGRSRILRLQKYLERLGFHPGRVNGYMTPKTRRAIQDYQWHYDLDGTGTVSPALLKHIRKQVILAS